MLPHLFLLVIALVIPLFFIFIFVSSARNKLAALRARYDHAQSQVDTTLQRRDAQIGEVVQLAQSAGWLEIPALQILITARAAAPASNPQDPAMVDAALPGALAELTAAIQTFLAADTDGTMTLKNLLRELATTQDRLSAARLACSQAEHAFHAAANSFPGSLIAALFPLRPAKC